MWSLKYGTMRESSVIGEDYSLELGWQTDEQTITCYCSPRHCFGVVAILY